MEFELTTIPDDTFSGLGTNLKKITYRGDIYAHLAILNGKLVVYINKVMPVENLRQLTEFISTQALQFPSIVSERGIVRGPY